MKPVKRAGRGFSINGEGDSGNGRESSSDYLQAIIDSLEDELLVVDKDYRIVQANQAVLSRHRKRREEVIGQYCYDIVHGLDELCRPPRHECPIKLTWETGKPARVTHLHVYHHKGEEKKRYLDIITSPIRDSQGDVIAVTELMRDVTEARELELKNARLHQEVQQKDEIRGELLSEILSIQEEERRRIARELHDETSQALAGLATSLEAMTGMLPPAADKIKARLRKAQSQSISILGEIHKLIYELRPTLLDDLGLVAAARWLADSNLGADKVKVDFRTRGRERRLPPQLEATLFRVIQEAISNIARHAHAQNVSMSLHFQKSWIKVHVGDDGRGFDVEEAIRSKERPRGLGLIGMRERVELVNGTLKIQSHPGGGTKMDIEIPLK